MKDRQTNKVRAKVVKNTDAPTLQGFVLDNSAPDAEYWASRAHQEKYVAWKNRDGCYGKTGSDVRRGRSSTLFSQHGTLAGRTQE